MAEPTVIAELAVTAKADVTHVGPAGGPAHAGSRAGCDLCEEP